MPRNQKIVFRQGTTTPSAPDFEVGEPAWDKLAKKFYLKAEDGTMVEIAGGGGGGGTGSYTASSNPPASPVEGDRWYDIDLGIEFTYVNDGNSSQWVETSTGGGASSSPIVETQQVISQDIELSAGTNGLSVGPVEVADTYAVTVPENATWMIV